MNTYKISILQVASLLLAITSALDYFLNLGVVQKDTAAAVMGVTTLLSAVLKPLVTKLSSEQLEQQEQTKGGGN